MKYAALALALLAVPASAQDAPRFTIEARPDLDWVTVPVVRPTAPNTAVALDLVPNGTPEEHGVLGRAWVHVCNADIGNPLNCAVVAAGDDAVRFGSSNYGQAAKPIEFVVGNKVVGTITTRQTIRVGDFDSAAVLRKIDALIRQNERQAEQIKVLHQRIRALERKR